MSQTEDSTPVTRTRGILRIGDPRVWGTIIGAIGATVFVMANRGALVEPWPAVAVTAWALSLAAYLAFVFMVPRHFGPAEPVRARAGFVYLGSVAGMLAVIALGTLALTSAGRVDLRPALIVVAVGAHFLPFATAFHTPLFIRLGAIMVAAGAVGLLLGWFWDGRAASIAAVVSGISMLIVIAGDAAGATRKSEMANRGATS
jgi:hypothetical protein